MTTHRFEAILGDSVAIEIGRDDAPRTVDVPDDLAAALAAEPGVRAAFDAMSYTQPAGVGRGG